MKTLSLDPRTKFSKVWLPLGNQPRAQDMDMPKPEGRIWAGLGASVMREWAVIVKANKMKQFLENPNEQTSFKLWERWVLMHDRKEWRGFERFLVDIYLVWHCENNFSIPLCPGDSLGGPATQVCHVPYQRLPPFVLLVYPPKWNLFKVFSFAHFFPAHSFSLPKSYPILPFPLLTLYQLFQWTQAFFRLRFWCFCLDVSRLHLTVRPDR